MIRLVPVLLALAACSAAGPSQKRSATPSGGAHIVDRAHLLPAATTSALDAKLRGFELATRHQIVVVTLPSLEGRSIEEASHVLGTELQVGRAREDDGVLLLVALGDRQVRLSVGDGLTGQLTPSGMAHILDRDIRPAFHARNFPKGISDGVDALVQALTPTRGTTT